jgi:hypothetical protein
MCMLTHIINRVSATHMHLDVLTFKSKSIHLEGKKDKIIKCNLWINIFYRFWNLDSIKFIWVVIVELVIDNNCFGKYN